MVVLQVLFKGERTAAGEEKHDARKFKSTHPFPPLNNQYDSSSEGHTARAVVSIEWYEERERESRSGTRHTARAVVSIE